MGICGSKSHDSPDRGHRYQDNRDASIVNHGPDSHNRPRSIDGDPRMGPGKGRQASAVGREELNRKNKKNKKFNEAAGEDHVIHEQITKSNHEPGAKDLEFIGESLRGHFFFSTLTRDEQAKVSQKMFSCSAEEGAFIFKQEDSASCFFIIREGEVAVEIDKNEKKRLHKGDSFGELALLYNAPRSASIKALTNCQFWAIDRITFRNVVSEVTTKQFKENREFLNKVPFFDAMTERQKDSIAGVILAQVFRPGENIISQGDAASSYYIIQSGTAECIKDDKSVRMLHEGDSFGEQALYESGHRTLTVRAATECKCLALSRGDLQEILGARIQQVIQGNWSRWAIEKDPIFCQLTKLQTEKWILNADIHKPKAGDVILQKDIRLSAVVIVLDGELQFGSRNFPKGTVFGGEFLYPKDNMDRTLVDYLKCKSDRAEISLIKLEKFQEIIGIDLQAVFEKNKTSHEAKMKDDNKDFRKQVADLTLNDLLFIKKLGEGQFGHVFLVKSATNGQLYALKAINRNQITEMSLERHTLQEKEVLEQINFNFIMKMYRTFKDPHFVYFLLSYVRGMELFDVIRQMDLLNNEDSQFYTSSMILAIEYLHHKKIVYRDLKPENIMIDEHGYLKLIDMGTAKILKSSQGVAKTFTILGTPHYMAPEILKSKGYGLAVDLWSIGICLFEFMCGMVPFGEDFEDPYEVYQLITHNTTLKYPKYFDPTANKAAKSMMEQLLNRIPEARLGGSYATLKAHKWFEKFDWDKLLDMGLKPPYVPPSNKLYSEVDIKKIAGKKIPVTQEIEKSAIKFKKGKGKTSMSKIPNWDKDF